MFFKQIFFSAILFSGFVVCVHADNDIIAPRAAGIKIINVVSCDDCPVPGKECKNYILTSADKICISSYVSANNDSGEKVRMNTVLHGEANREDVHNLENDLSYSGYYVPHPVADVNVQVGKEPFTE